MSEFEMIRFNAYITLLNEYLNTKSKKKKKELVIKLEEIKVGLVPVKYL